MTSGPQLEKAVVWDVRWRLAVVVAASFFAPGTVAVVERLFAVGVVAAEQLVVEPTAVSVAVEQQLPRPGCGRDVPSMFFGSMETAGCCRNLRRVLHPSIESSHQLVSVLPRNSHWNYRRRIQAALVLV